MRGAGLRGRIGRMKSAVLRLLMVLAAALAFPALSANRAVLVGSVTRIVDGDTIDVQLTSGPIRVRLNGIDTPERGQPWEPEATAALTQLVMGKSVDLEPFEQDRYDRLIANVLLGSLDVDAELVKQGHAWAFRRYMTRDNSHLCTLEHEARVARRGLWSLPNQQRIAPWEWRQRKKRESFMDYSNETVANCIAAIGRN
jgi:endonuclease YncB( thermonuclease family)